MIDGKDWKGVEDLIGHHPEALTVNISDSKTIFHHIVNFIGDDIEAARVIDKLASNLNPRTLEQKDSRGFTVLHLSAITGMKSASETLVKYHGNLPNAWSNDIWLPVHYAAYYGKKDTVQYLVSVTAKKNLVDINGARLISYLINSNLYDVALDILKENPAIGRDHIRSRKMVLKTLAGKPSAFASGTQLGCLRFIYNWIPVKKEKFSSIDQTNRNRSADVDVENGISEIYSTNSTAFGFLPKITTFFCAMCQDLHIRFWNALILLFPCIKAMHDKKLTHLQSVEILRMICEGVAWNDPEIFRKNDKDIFETWLFLHTAAEIGISEFFNEIIIDYNDSLYRTNSEGHHIFHLAVLHRQENIFNLIHRFRYLSDMLNMYDKSGNNMLHLAGRLVPSSKVAGAALQMQRELQWFKAVEDLLPQWHQEEKNSKNLTPRELFAESHKELVKEGEKWMKDTAQSCTIAATLIITVVFAAAFTVPGGNNDRGQPFFLKEKSFLIFAISDALAFFSSTTSLLMFLGILTSRYSENDFLVSLPRKLIIGLITLFFSIASMIVAFGGSIHIVLSQPWKWVIIPIALLGCVPVTLFALLQFRLLFDMFYYTYGPSIFHPVNLTLKCVSN
ncbi:putative Ankyrin repeat-containing protein [Melia azedarach]|uniref:Ankyrin repeat-containing protein n=1 Tax=Melia azedarach TaxID=155640 RepID=A0ACC1Y194_MELAZ|nr:putative Ankyrin repeat-containing protein [Melia azedarach]